MLHPSLDLGVTVLNGVTVLDVFDLGVTEECKLEGGVKWNDSSSGDWFVSK